MLVRRASQRWVGRGQRAGPITGCPEVLRVSGQWRQQHSMSVAQCDPGQLEQLAQVAMQLPGCLRFFCSNTNEQTGNIRDSDAGYGLV